MYESRAWGRLGDVAAIVAMWQQRDSQSGAVCWQKACKNRSEKEKEKDKERRLIVEGSRTVPGKQ